MSVERKKDSSPTRRYSAVHYLKKELANLHHKGIEMNKPLQTE